MENKKRREEKLILAEARRIKRKYRPSRRRVNEMSELFRISEPPPSDRYDRVRMAIIAGYYDDLSNQDLSGLDLRGATLDEVNLGGADLRSVDLSRSTLEGANLHNANLERAKLIGAKMAGADLEIALLSDANFQGADLTGASLRDARFARASFVDANLTGADLGHAMFKNVDFKGADLRNVNFLGAKMWDVGIEGADLRGAKLPEGWEEAVIGIPAFYPDGFSSVKSRASESRALGKDAMVEAALEDLLDNWAPSLSSGEEAVVRQLLKNYRAGDFNRRDFKQVVGIVTRIMNSPDLWLHEDMLALENILDALHPAII